MSKKNTEKPAFISQINNIPNKLFFGRSALVLVLITLFVYVASLNNEFTYWDDNAYVTENNAIKTLHGDSIAYTLKNTFTGYVGGNYHPITMLTFCIEYRLFQLNPFPYHLTNVMIHLLNTLLVFYFIWLLTKQRITALVTALLFAIHPMHVESVAWVAERKDVLYTFFYLSALCAYIHYVRKEKLLLYLLTFLLFACSFLSKAMAVTLPLTFLLIDYFMKRGFGKKVLLEKAPFFIVSIIIGLVAIDAQKSVEAIHVSQYSYFERILFATYATLQYLWKFIVPANLYCAYPYPLKTNGSYPFLVYASPFIIGLLFIAVYKSKTLKKEWFWGGCFFLITLVPVLQFLPVGGVLMADRYTYLLYIGLSFMVAQWMHHFLENKSPSLQPYKNLLVAAVVGVTLVYSYLTIERCKVWKNDITLWTDAIEKNDSLYPFYEKRGDAFAKKQEHQKAISDYTRSLQLMNIDNPNLYFNRGFAYGSIARYPEAILDFNKAIALDSALVDAYLNRGNAYFNLQKYETAIRDYSKAILLNPDKAVFYYSRGLSYDQLMQYDSALQDYTRSISINPNNDEAYVKMGIIYYNTQQYQKAVEAYSAAININSERPFIYYNRALAYFFMKNKKQALSDALKAKEMGYNVNPAFMSDLTKE